MTVYLFIYFNQYLVRGAQFSKADLNGALMKKQQQQQQQHTWQKNNQFLDQRKIIYIHQDPITLFVHQRLLSNFNDASYRNQEPVKGVAIAASKWTR